MSAVAEWFKQVQEERKQEKQEKEKQDAEEMKEIFDRLETSAKAAKANHEKSFRIKVEGFDTQVIHIAGVIIMRQYGLEYKYEDDIGNELAHAVHVKPERKLIWMHLQPRTRNWI